MYVCTRVSVGKFVPMVLIMLDNAWQHGQYYSHWFDEGAFLVRDLGTYINYEYVTCTLMAYINVWAVVSKLLLSCCKITKRYTPKEYDPSVDPSGTFQSVY